MSTTAEQTMPIFDDAALKDLGQYVGLMEQGPDYKRAAESDRGAIGGLTAAVFDLARERAAAAEKFTPAGLAEHLASRRKDVLGVIGRFEGATETMLADLQSTRRSIENGELVRNAAGAFDRVRLPEMTPALAIKLSEMRSAMRSMTPAESEAIVLAADEAGDTEMLQAVADAPKALPVINSSTRRTLAERRWVRAGWNADYESAIETVALRQRVAGKVREALGIKS